MRFFHFMSLFKRSDTLVECWSIAPFLHLSTNCSSSSDPSLEFSAHRIATTALSLAAFDQADIAFWDPHNLWRSKSPQFNYDYLKRKRRLSRSLLPLTSCQEGKEMQNSVGWSNSNGNHCRSEIWICEQKWSITVSYFQMTTIAFAQNWPNMCL
jgi:hypothetical protein